MKSRLPEMLGFVVMALLVFHSFTPAAAQEMSGRFAVGAQISYYDLDEDHIGEVDYEFDGAALMGFNLSYFFTRNFVLQLSAEYTDTTLDTVSGPYKLEFGDFEQYPILLTGQYRFPTAFGTDFFVGVGVGYYINRFDLSDLYRRFYPSAEIDADDSFGYHLAGGFEVFVTESWSLGAELRYVWNKADFTFRQPGGPEDSQEIQLDGFIAGIGLKYYF